MLHSRLLMVAAVACLAPRAYAQDPGQGDAENGKELFASRCSVCHFEDSADKKIGPGLAGIKDGKLPSEKEATPENVLENLNKGGNGMPPFETLLSDDEKADIVAYVLSL